MNLSYFWRNNFKYLQNGTHFLTIDFALKAVSALDNCYSKLFLDYNLLVRIVPNVKNIQLRNRKLARIFIIGFRY